MDYNDSFIDNNGKKIIITSHKEVFEEVPEPRKRHEKYEYEEYDEYENESMCQCEKKRKKMYEVDKVLGTGSGNTIVEVCIPLCPPAVEVLYCLATENVIFDVLKAKKGKVFINGRLLKSIPYRAKHDSWTSTHGCCPQNTCGNTKCAVTEVPFIICVNVPGAAEGSKVVVIDYDVNTVNIPHPGCGCLIKSIVEKDCISVRVKAVKPEIVSLHSGCCNGCR